LGGLFSWGVNPSIAISLIFRLIILQRARCNNNVLILSMLQLFIRSTVATYSILPIGQFFVVAQFFFLPLAPWPVFLQKAVLAIPARSPDDAVA